MEHAAQLYIGGEWKEPSTNARLPVISPHSEEIFAESAVAGPVDVDRAVGAARAAFDYGPWPQFDPQTRIDAVTRLSTLYGERRREMAQLITAEIGAPITFSKRAQVGLPAALMTALTAVAADFPWRETRRGAYGSDIVIARHPVGVVAAIVPWNMPQFLTIGKLIPALLAGCTVVVKAAPESPLDSLLLAEIVDSAGLPAGVVNVIPGGRLAGASLVDHPGVDKISFTGSTDAGRQVALGCAAGLKQVSLELGGKSAAIILDDAEPASAAAEIRRASLANSGQVCNALTRILVPGRRRTEFVDALATELESIVIGDPADPVTELGPLVSARQQSHVKGYIREGQREGATLVVGGDDTAPGMKRGWYVRPTLFADAHNGMRIAREEIFGPVLTVIPYRDEQDAIRIANDSEYGLAGAVFSPDEARARQVADGVRTGSFGINQGYIMDPAAPFGGVKGSGYGRELGREGLASYLNSQSISSAREVRS